jgi:hypothetical protein
MALCALGVREAKFNSMLELRLTPPAITGGGGRVVVVVVAGMVVVVVVVGGRVVVVVGAGMVVVVGAGMVVVVGAGMVVVVGGRVVVVVGGRVVVVVGFFNLLNFVLTWPDVVVVVTCLNVMIAVVGCLVDAGAGAEVVEPPERSDVAPETPENARELTRTASATTVTTPPATTRRRWTGVAR